MDNDQWVDAITNGFSSPTLLKQTGKPSYVSIRDTHRLLTANAASIKSPRKRDQNGHLGLVLTATQHSLVCQVPFIRPTDSGHTTNIPAWKTPFDEKSLLREHTEQRQKYNKCRNVDAALRNQLLKSFDDTYFLPHKSVLTGYSGATTLQLLRNLYAHYMRISATGLTNNNKKLREVYNPNDPLESL